MQKTTIVIENAFTSFIFYKKILFEYIDDIIEGYLNILASSDEYAIKVNDNILIQCTRLWLIVSVIRPGKGSLYEQFIPYSRFMNIENESGYIYYNKDVS